VEESEDTDSVDGADIAEAPIAVNRRGNYDFHSVSDGKR
jgi:hypothetical protein